MSNTIALQRPGSIPDSGIAGRALAAVAGCYAVVVAVLSNAMRPQQESPAAAAARLRDRAGLYGTPSDAADRIDLRR